MDTICGGRARYVKGVLQCVDSFGNKQIMDQLLSQKFTMKNKPPWTLLLNELTDTRKKHWERFDPKKHELFLELSLDNVKINGSALTVEHQIILSTMIMHPNIHQGVNMYNNAHLVYDRAFHEESFIYNNYEDNEIPDIEVRNKITPKQNITNETICNFNKYIKLSKALNKDIKIQIEKNIIALTIEQRISLKTNTIFQRIDEFGHITNPQWFLDLNREQLIILLRNLVDIWDYRANLSTIIKRQICPPNGNPFYGINIQSLINNYNLHVLKMNLLNIFENMLYKSNDVNNQSLGAFYILGALTITNQEAANTMPWLYESFNITPEN